VSRPRSHKPYQDMAGGTVEDWRRVQARREAEALHAPRSVPGPARANGLSVADLPGVPDGGQDGQGGDHRGDARHDGRGEGARAPGWGRPRGDGQGEQRHEHAGPA
jgi:hypothetical protein